MRARHGSEYHLKKAHSIEDTESVQFEDSLMEQSSPAADAKDLPDGSEPASLNDTANMRFGHGGSYHMQ